MPKRKRRRGVKRGHRPASERRLDHAGGRVRVRCDGCSRELTNPEGPCPRCGSETAAYA